MNLVNKCLKINERPVTNVNVNEKSVIDKRKMKIKSKKKKIAPKWKNMANIRMD